jgi:4-hydroxyphenylpyruvate dioxygenase
MSVSAGPRGRRSARGRAAPPRTAVATVCLSGTLEDKLAAAAAAGFDGVEIFEPTSSRRPSSAAEVRRRCADLGLTIDLYQPFRDFDSTDPQRLAANLRRAEHKFAVMEALGTDLILVCSSCLPTPSTTTTASPSSCTPWPSGPARAACACRTRRWPGAGT